MPLSQSDRAYLKQLYGNLADEALQPDSPFYEPVYQELGLDDPVQQISTLIDFDGVESIRLFSGFRGSGKTTELLRLRRLLEDRGYFVLYADALNYVNAAEPIEITDLRMVMAGAFSDTLEETLGSDIARETFWDRIWTFLNTEINLKEATAKVGYETPAKELFGSVKTGLDLKFELKSATNFRRELQGFLANKLKELKNNVDRFLSTGLSRFVKHTVRVHRWSLSSTSWSSFAAHCRPSRMSFVASSEFLPFTLISCESRMCTRSSPRHRG
jgi:hypothetical protein